MKKFEVGREYLLTQDAIAITIARVVARNGVWAEFEFPIAGKVRRYTWRIRTAYGISRKPRAEAVIPSEYDAIFAYDAIGGYR